MIKKVTLVKQIEDKFPIQVDLLKIEPPISNKDKTLKAEYLIGGFYKTIGFAICAFFASDEDGNILDDIPIIHEEGLNTYADVFRQYDYIYL